MSSTKELIGRIKSFQNYHCMDTERCTSCVEENRCKRELAEIKRRLKQHETERVDLVRTIAGLEAEIKDLKWQLSGEEP